MPYYIGPRERCVVLMHPPRTGGARAAVCDAEADFMAQWGYVA